MFLRKNIIVFIYIYVHGQQIVYFMFIDIINRKETKIYLVGWLPKF